MNVILVNFPDRETDLNRVKNNSVFTFNFAKRHDLLKFYPEDEKERNFECDVCFKRFTYKNAMVAHKKRIHYSFLQ